MSQVNISHMTNNDWWRFVKVMRNHRVKKTITQKELFKSKTHWAKGFFILMRYWADYFYKIEYDGKFAGYIIITKYWFIEDENEYDYGKSTVTYAILPNFSGKGITTEALNQALYEYDNSKEERPVFGMTHSDNYASQKVLEKNGFVTTDFAKVSMSQDNKRCLFIRSK